MNKFYFFYLSGLVLILYWNFIILTQIDDKWYYVTSLHDTCYFLNIQAEPNMTVLRRPKQTRYSNTVEQFTKETCKSSPIHGKWMSQERPIIGDHIHMGMVLSVNGQILNFHDRNMSQLIPYEVDNYPVTCANPGAFAYEKRWYHTGVHTHCDGNIVHIHPWSAPNELRVEGRAVKLKLWFESVGIEVATDFSGLKLPGDSDYTDGWSMEYYINVKDKTPAFRTNSIEAIKNLWLVDHHGEILLWVGDKPDKDDRVLKYKSHPINYPKRYL